MDGPSRRSRIRVVASSQWSSALALAVVIACGIACGDSVDEAPPRTTANEACALPGRVRRLTRGELDAAASAVVGPTTLFTDSLAAEDRPLGFDNHEGLVVSGLLLDQLGVVSSKLADRVVADPRWSCGGDERACFDAFVADFVTRTFRRPVTTEERDGLFTVFQAGRDGADYAGGLHLVAEAVFQSTSFLYRTELGAEGQTGVRVLEGHELAAELSFLVTGGPPDDELSRAAAEGKLLEPEERARHARRLLATDQGRKRLENFVLQWAGLSELESIQKDNVVYSEFSADWRASMRAETHTFVEHLFREGDGKLSTLLGADYTFVDDRMAEFYGLPDRPGTTPARVKLPPERRGLLTQASVLSTYAHFGDTSPVHRGKMVFTTLLCGQMPPPPPTVNTSLPVPDGVRTTRERLRTHTDNPSCAGCHMNMDPIGLGFEDFDGIGKHRTVEADAPVDASGAIVTPKTVGDGSAFTGGAQGAGILASHPEVEECLSRQLYRYGFGRKETAMSCETGDVRQALEQSGGDLREVLIAYARSSAFSERKDQTP